MCKKYLSVETKNRIISADVGEVILLSAPVGSGKTTFIISDLWMSARLARKRVLLVVNRSSLRGQLVKEVMKKLGLDTVQMENSAIRVFDSLTVVSYQYLQARFGQGIPTPGMKIGDCKAGEFKYVVFDEIHYLFSDSEFNSETYALAHMPDAFPSAVRMYMSATIEPVRELILKLENITDNYSGIDEEDRVLINQRYTDSRCVQNSLFANAAEGKSRRCIELTGAEADFSYFRPVVFDEKDDLSKLILKRIRSGDEGKWLVFVNNMEKAEDIRRILQENSIDTAFVSASNTREEDIEAMESLQKDKMFHQTVLIATSVIDNGVSILDDMVTHLVIDGVDRIQVIQQAGRIRIRENQQSIELWLCRYSAKFFNNRRYDTVTKIMMIEKYKKLPTDAGKIDYLLNSGNTDIKKYLWSNHQGKWYVNPIAYEALLYREKEYTRFLAIVKDDPNGHIREMLSWFELSDSNVMDIQAEKRETALLEFVGFCRDTDRIMSEKLWSEWAGKFKEKYEKAKGEAQCKDHPKREFGINVINKCMAEYEVGLQIRHDTRKKIYILQEVQDVSNDFR